MHFDKNWAECFQTFLSSRIVKHYYKDNQKAATTSSVDTRRDFYSKKFILFFNWYAVIMLIYGASYLLKALEGSFHDILEVWLKTIIFNSLFTCDSHSF